MATLSPKVRCLLWKLTQRSPGRNLHEPFLCYVTHNGMSRYVSLAFLRLAIQLTQADRHHQVL